MTPIIPALTVPPDRKVLRVPEGQWVLLALVVLRGSPALPARKDLPVKRGLLVRRGLSVRPALLVRRDLSV